MLNYNKNELINTTLDKYYETFSHTLDTQDFVPEKYNGKICKYIFKNMKKAFRRIDREDRKYQRSEKRKYKAQVKEIKKQEKLNKPKKINVFKKVFGKLFSRVKRQSANSNKSS